MKNGHFFSLSATPEIRGSASTLRTWTICFCGDLEKITISFKHTRKNCHLTVEKITSIVRWNVPGPLRNLNGMRMNRYIQ